MLETDDPRLKALPDSPGCYVFKDAAGTEIYVGKAKNLKRRVRSYFQGGRGHVARTLRLVQEVADLATFETGSEVEALLLENQLIKELQPRFNVKLKDDKTYPLLAITREEFPLVFITRDRERTDVDYYGPYGSASELRKAYNFLMRVFQFRVCTMDIRSDDPARRRFRPCLNFHIKRCSAPCTTRIDAEAYQADIRSLRAFLTGRGRAKVVKELKERMRVAADELRYEDAARCRDQLQALERLKERGRLRDYDSPAAPVIDNDQAVTKLADSLGLTKPPRLIEGFDIAHLQGTDVVASMVQFVDGLPNKNAYRRFKVRGGVDIDAELGAGERNDDFAAMAEVVSRRYCRLRDEGAPMPDLILIDGGLGQVHAAEAALKEAGLGDLTMVGLAKKEEIIIHPDGSESRLGKRHPGLKLLMFVRDEAHRFCRRYHHLLRQKRLDR